MLYRFVRQGKRQVMMPERLPCGCKVIGNAMVVGLDGNHIEGATGLNTKTGWLRVQAWVLNPSLVVKTLPEGGRMMKPEGVENVNLSQVPFELRCKRHGCKLDEPEEHAGHGRRRSLCACGVTERAECCAAYGCPRCAEALYHRAAAAEVRSDGS